MASILSFTKKEDSEDSLVTFTIKQTTDPEQLSVCHEILVTVFHRELGLSGMRIPDHYDSFSAYMQIIDCEEVIGTYRIVFPNASVGLPIEAVGFDLSKLESDQICEMSRLVVLKEKRGKIPFSKIVYSACQVAEQNNASRIVAAILPRNVPLFKRYGFSPAGAPLNDPSVESSDIEEAVIVPMQIGL